MSNLQTINVANASPTIAKSLAAVNAKLGSIPNMFLTLANTPVALNGYLQLSAATAEGNLTAKQREAIALAVGQENACGYCVAAHSVIGNMVGLTATEISEARAGKAVTSRDTALIALAISVTKARGHLTAAEVASFKAAGLSDADILEVITNVALNVLTNYVNHVAATEIDFPAVELRLAA